MQLIPQATFIAEAKAFGLTDDDAPSVLSFGHYEQTDRFWLWPWPPADILGLLSAILQHTAPIRYFDAWRPGGVWHDTEPSYIDTIRSHLLRGFDIPADHYGALRFERGEAAALSALVLAFAVAGWNVDDDVCLVPDSGDYLIRLSHHAVIHVECRTTELVEPLIQHLASKGWQLPTEVPDATFKVPSWMQPATRDHEAPT